ncbi:MAG TPA: hypothetical protein VET90_03790, partial [Candidatus Binatus sp.]|nr:hypothetical protein [Candidatus Binatus sp.]
LIAQGQTATVAAGYAVVAGVVLGSAVTVLAAVVATIARVASVRGGGFFIAVVGGIIGLGTGFLLLIGKGGIALAGLGDVIGAILCEAPWTPSCSRAGVDWWGGVLDVMSGGWFLAAGIVATAIVGRITRSATEPGSTLRPLAGAGAVLAAAVAVVTPAATLLVVAPIVSGWHLPGAAAFVVAFVGGPVALVGAFQAASVILPRDDLVTSRRDDTPTGPFRDARAAIVRLLGELATSDPGWSIVSVARRPTLYATLSSPARPGEPLIGRIATNEQLRGPDRLDKAGYARLAELGWSLGGRPGNENLGREWTTWTGSTAGEVADDVLAALSVTGMGPGDAVFIDREIDDYIHRLPIPGAARAGRSARSRLAAGIQSAIPTRKGSQRELIRDTILELATGSNDIVIFSMSRRPEVYAQVMRPTATDGPLLGEIVGNAYLDLGERLDAGRIARLEDLGWTLDPAGGNPRREWADWRGPDANDVAADILRALGVYGLRPDDGITVKTQAG